MRGVSLKQLGGENRSVYSKRLKDEGRWKDFIEDRDIMAKYSGMSRVEVNNILLIKYGRGTLGTPNANFIVRPDGTLGEDMESAAFTLNDVPSGDDKKPKKGAAKVKTVSEPKKKEVVVNESRASSKYEDRLPNGCPLWDPSVFKSKESRYYEDVMWTERNLARSDLTESNIHEHCPTLSCAKYFWSARFTNLGYADHCKTVELITIRDKSSLNTDNQRRDDGRALDYISRALQGLSKRLKDE